MRTVSELYSGSICLSVDFPTQNQRRAGSLDHDQMHAVSGLRLGMRGTSGPTVGRPALATAGQQGCCARSAMSLNMGRSLACLMVLRPPWTSTACDIDRDFGGLD